MISEQQEAYLEEYLGDGEIPPTHRQAVLDLLRTDADFREEFTLRSQLQEAARRVRLAPWKERTAAYEAPVVERPLRPLRTWRWAVAASVAVMAGVLGWWWLRPAPAGVPLLTGNGPVYERLGIQGLAVPADLVPADSAYLVVAEARVVAPAYEFARPDTLRVFLPPGTSPDGFRGWRLFRSSETEYQLHTPTATFSLQQGRKVRQPLRAIPSGGR